MCIRSYFLSKGVFFLLGHPIGHWQACRLIILVKCPLQSSQLEEEGQGQGPWGLGSASWQGLWVGTFQSTGLGLQANKCPAVTVTADQTFLQVVLRESTHPEESSLTLETESTVGKVW